MKRKNLSLFFITLLISLLASCRDELSTAGGKWVESSLRTIQTDTCTVRLSTILSDSLATSGDTVCQIGTIDDPVWGKIKAAFYVEYDVPTVSFSENADYRFDSITIRFYSSGNYLGDTLSPQRISLHVSSTLAVSNIRNRTYTNYEVYLIGYGYGKFKEKIHFME